MRRSLGSVTVALLGLAAVPAVTSGQASQTITPPCAQPGQRVRLQSTVAKNSVTRVDLFGIPHSIDPETTSTSTVSVPESAWAKLGSFQLVTTDTSAAVDATFDLPKQTAYKGMEIDGWEITAKQYGADGTFFGLGGVGGFIDSGHKFAAIEPETVKGNEVNYRAAGFGTQKLFAHLTKGKTTKDFALAPSSDNPDTGGAACGDSHGSFSTAKLKKGTWKLVVNTSRTKRTGGVKGNKLRVR